MMISITEDCREDMFRKAAKTLGRAYFAAEDDFRVCEKIKIGYVLCLADILEEEPHAIFDAISGYMEMEDGVCV